MKTVKRFFDHLCWVYTISAMLFLLLNLAIAGSLEDTLINAQSFLLVFVFAVGFALANVIYTAKFASNGVRLALHFVLVTLSAFLFLCLPANTAGGASGKIVILIVMVLLFAFPVAVGVLFGVTPDWNALLVGLIATAPMYWAVGIIETVTYVPMLGAGGSYLSFVTGNISNLKLPCALNALEQNELSASTEEGEIISTVAIATSSIVTTLIIIVGVILIVPLTPVLSAPALQPAFEQILPALFGGLGVAFVSKNWKIAVAPVILMLGLFVFIPALNSGTVGIMVPVSALFTIGVARILYKRGIL